MNICSVDPGRQTGLAIYNCERFSHVQTVGIEAFAVSLDALLANCDVDIILCEGWQRRGDMDRRLNAATIYPNRVLGVCEGLAVAHALPMHEVYASRWKSALYRNADCLPAVPGIRADMQRMGKAVAAHMGGYPHELFKGVPRSLRGHALDACGLALWGKHHLRGAA